MFYVKIDFAMEISRFRRLTNAPSNAKISFEILLHQTPFHSICGYKPLITPPEKICTSGITCPCYELRIDFHGCLLITIFTCWFRIAGFCFLGRIPERGFTLTRNELLPTVDYRVYKSISPSKKEDSSLFLHALNILLTH